MKRKISKTITPRHNVSNTAFHEPNYDDYCETDDIGDYNELFEIMDDLGSKTYLKELQNSDFMEDPCLYENIEEGEYHNNSLVDLEPLINHFEEFIERGKKLESSELSSASEKVIEKIKDLDLNTADIEKLIEEVERDSKTESIKDYLKEALESNEFDLNSDKFKQLDSNEKLKLLCQDNENLKAVEIEDLIAILNNENQKDNNSRSCEDFINEISKLVYDSQTAMEGRLMLIENQDQFNETDRKVNDVYIESEDMRSIDLSYNDIVKTHCNIITKLKYLFQDLRNQNDVDNSQKRGRLNNKFIKAVTSDFKYDKCFTRKLTQKELKILMMVDISGSMAGIKLEAAKVAMVMLCESLYEIAQLRIVLFTGEYDALNIQLKDFEEYPDIKKFDKFGRHQRIGSNLDGVSLKHEAAKLEKNVLILMISDGQPAGTQYGLNDAIKEIQDVKKKFKVYAFSIDAKGDYLNKLYGNNWILTKSSDRTDLAEKLTQFCKLVIIEYFR